MSLTCAYIKPLNLMIRAFRHGRAASSRLVVDWLLLLRLILVRPIVTALLHGNRLSVGWVGDSRAYWVTESASELLAGWRAAKRDTAAAHTAQKVAILALAAAVAAEEAADEVETAAAAAATAVELARGAAERARKAAAAAAEAAQMLLAAAEGDQARAGQGVDKAELAETTARDAFHDAESKGFPKT